MVGAMPDDPGDGVIHLIVPSDAGAVRKALQVIFGATALQRLQAADRDSAEIVLAEVMNNIVEHAYATLRGEIDITIRREVDGLACTVVDRGHAMPDARLPAGTLTTTPADLPEGGFGWHLIRELARDLVYQRVGDRNELSFRLTLEQ